MPLRTHFVQWCVAAVFICGLSALASSFFSFVAHAQQEAGLSISPSRKSISLQAGASASGHVIIRNQTQEPMTVTMSYGEFSVADYSYDYIFDNPKEKWITFSQEKIELRPGQRQPVFYKINIPANAASADRYLTIYASTVSEGVGITNTLRVASMLLVTIDSEKARQTVDVGAVDTSRLVIGGASIPYTYDVKNTGNTYISGHSYASLTGWFGYFEEKATNAILYVDSTRRFQDSLRAPLLPGMYQLRYGYAYGEQVDRHEKAVTIWYIPLWSLLLFLGVVWIVFWIVRRKMRHKREVSSGR